MKRIPLTQGKVALVSDADYWQVRAFRWIAWWSGWGWYAETWVAGKVYYMHRLLVGFPPFALDHKNGNGIDNRRSNLRPATCSQNLANRGAQRNNTSGFKGVSWNKQCAKWQAHIMVSQKSIYLGMFTTPKAASEAYKVAAIKHFGKFARAA